MYDVLIIGAGPAGLSVARWCDELGLDTLVLEKQSGFAPADVQENLCVLMLMLPSANRQTKEQLRMFRDSGGFDRFNGTDGASLSC